MRIGVDVDGVLASFNDGFARRLIATSGRNLMPPEPYEITVWSWPQYYGYTSAEESAAWEAVKAQDDFWLSLTPYPQTADTLATLAWASATGIHDIYFITSRPGYKAKQQTERWLRHCGFGAHPTVLISSMKGLCARALMLDTYIDDNIANVEDVCLTARGCRVFLQTQPWNRTYQERPDLMTRVVDPLEMLKALGLMATGPEPRRLADQLI